MSADNPIRKSKAAYNPYRRAAMLVVRRLQWDLQPASWSSRKKIRATQHTFKGKKAVILCNGPSLNDVDFSKLKGTYTFGLNKINLLFERTDFRPSCIVAVNPFVIEQNAAFYNQTDIPCYLANGGIKQVRNRQNIAFLHTGSSAEDAFSRDCSLSIHTGATVTYVALQLAFHMGFEAVTLVGCDHYFSTLGQANKVVEAGEKDPNHFDPNYFSGGVKWQLPDLARSEYNYYHAREIYEEFGRKLYNSTTKTALDLIERMPLDKFLAL